VKAKGKIREFRAEKYKGGERLVTSRKRKRGNRTRQIDFLQERSIHQRRWKLGKRPTKQFRGGVKS